MRWEASGGTIISPAKPFRAVGRRPSTIDSTERRTMLVQINFGDVQHSAAIESWAEERVRKQLGYLTERLTRVEVHLRDDSSAAKSSHDDKRCVMEARIAGRRPLAVEHFGADLYKVIDETAAKLSRAVKTDTERGAAR